MLLGLFFEIQLFTANNPESEQQNYQAVVLLNASHTIFKGHFPGNPVVPGVCQIQMVKELVEKAVVHRLNLISSDNVKFLSMITPTVYPQLEFNFGIKRISNNQISVTATIGFESTLFFKFKGKFETAE
ncbi:MAG: 3-hydroxyacyl-ACP dehydratase [Bacteroidetes bacterium]|nr:3-hydroxyacyl-ACP dehydratase [Bacteroidota bacterium]